MTALKLLAVLATVSAGMARTARAGHGAPPLGAPASPFSNVRELYEQGKLSEARGSLLRTVRAAVEYGRRTRGKRPIDIRERLAIGVTARLVAHCFAFEAKYGGGQGVPEELSQACDLIVPAIDAALAHAAGSQEERIRNQMAYARTQKAGVVTSQITAYRDAGHLALARTLLERHRAFLKSAHIKSDTLLAQPVAEEKVDWGQKVADGRTLAICHLVIEYYRALAAGDAEALSRCLASGPDSVTAEQLLERTGRREASPKAIQRTRLLVFDADSRLSITPLGKNELDVLCAGVLMRSEVGGQTVFRRHTERFRVTRVRHEYRILLQRAQGEER